MEKGNFEEAKRILQLLDDKYQNHEIFTNLGIINTNPIIY